MQEMGRQKVLLTHQIHLLLRLLPLQLILLTYLLVSREARRRSQRGLLLLRLRQLLLSRRRPMAQEVRRRSPTTPLLHRCHPLRLEPHVRPPLPLD